ncbi:beta-ketoacyl-ACP synthase 3 [Streptomyces sp. 35G-GA-8]|uniref:beta-ketoacyl-ACP synthase 3 n=1 Tax=Streptomyces sp. 35G-GA-8 TaxID=2939434 RepID=UPI00201F126C|nr:beta-ketoacyl-ACP synthase 3 [Streptomyces sp. 35G-GA-8]MCL7379684.1 beta-ketoacyl-ACP synthase 3 [Streptomyces sp. 35G-GA-8]
MLEAVAGWVPGEPVPNEALPAEWGVDDAWIRTRTGIAGRHRAAPGMSTGDLAYEAARLLVADPVRAGSAGAGSARAGSGEAGSGEAGSARAADAVVLATATPDHLIPGTAPALAARLGLGTVPAFDIDAVCSGFVYGLAVCHGLVVSGICERVLLVGADVYSTWLDPRDRSSGVVFGDGAGAALIGAGRAGDPGELIAFDLGSDGTGYDLITVAGGGARSRSVAGPSAEGDEFFRMRGRAVYQHAVERMTGSCRSLLRTVGWDAAEVDHFVPHQANARILRAVAERLGIGARRCVTHLDRVGNTGAASIPLALADADARGRFRAGDRMLLTAFGGGLTWGTVALRWPATTAPAAATPPTIAPAMTAVETTTVETTTSGAVRPDSSRATALDGRNGS